MERVARAAHIDDIAIRVYQESDPAGPGDLLRCSIWDYCVCVHGAIVIRDRIRDKDKDPSFSAKQTRDESEIHERLFLALSGRCGNASLAPKDGGKAKFNRTRYSKAGFVFIPGFGSIASGSRCRLENASWDGDGIEVDRELVTLLFIFQGQGHRDGRAAVRSRLFDFDDQEIVRAAGFSGLEIPALGGLGEDVLHAAAARRQPPGGHGRGFVARDRYFRVALFRR